GIHRQRLCVLRSQGVDGGAARDVDGQRVGVVDVDAFDVDGAHIASHRVNDVHHGCGVLPFVVGHELADVRGAGGAFGVCRAAALQFKRQTPGRVLHDQGVVVVATQGEDFDVLRGVAQLDGGG